MKKQKTQGAEPPSPPLFVPATNVMRENDALVAAYAGGYRTALEVVLEILGVTQWAGDGVAIIRIEIDKLKGKR